MEIEMEDHYFCEVCGFGWTDVLAAEACEAKHREKKMDETFTIKVEGEDEAGFTNCKRAGQGITLNNGTYLTRERCHAILRKMAELSEEVPAHEWVEDGGEAHASLAKGLYSEGYLIRVLHSLQVAKYHKKPLTAEEKVEKAATFLKSCFRDRLTNKEVDSVCEAINILEG